MRDRARSEIGSFVEIYVDCPIEECISRDVKGLYKKALGGEIEQFTGISDPYEPPVDPDLVLVTHQETPESSLQKIIDGLVRLGYLHPKPRDSKRTVSG
jgi:adenylylsulfate kinase-like enzyme